MKEDIARRIDEGYSHRKKDGSLKQIRTDAVKAIGTIITGSPEGMAKIQKEGKLDEWAYRNLEWMEKKFGAKNIVRFALHMDEKTPHIHAVFVPLTEDGKLSTKEILGGHKQLSQMQDEHAELNSQFGLKRGLENGRITPIEDKIKHVTTREYYRDLNAIDKPQIKTNRLGMVSKDEQERINEVMVQNFNLAYHAKDSLTRDIKALEDRMKKKENELGVRYALAVEKSEKKAEKKIEKETKILKDKQVLADKQKDVFDYRLGQLQPKYQEAIKGVEARENTIKEDLINAKRAGRMQAIRHINPLLEEGLSVGITGGKFVLEDKKNQDKKRGMGM